MLIQRDFVIFPFGRSANEVIYRQMRTQISPTKRGKIAVDELVENIKRDIRTLAGAGGRIPTILELSKRYGRASVTVNRAVHRLADEGLLIVRPRNGIYLAPANAKRKAIEVGYLYWDFSNQGVQRLGLSLILYGLHTVLGNLNFNIHLLPCPALSQDGIRVNQALLSSGQLEYLLIDAPTALREDEEQLLQDWGIKTIATGFSPVDQGHAQVLIDSIRGTKDILEYAYSMGHRRFGVFEPDFPPMNAIVVTIRDWMKEKEVSGDDLRICRYAAWPGGPRAYDWGHLLTPPLPSVFVCHDDITAFALLTRLTENGLRVPDDVSIAVIENALDFVSPGFFTSLDSAHTLIEVGVALGRLLVQAVQTGVTPSSDKPIVIRSKLMIGKSVKRIL